MLFARNLGALGWFLTRKRPAAGGGYRAAVSGCRAGWHIWRFYAFVLVGCGQLGRCDQELVPSRATREWLVLACVPFIHVAFTRRADCLGAAALRRYVRSGPAPQGRGSGPC
ncbi:hypothetical protein [Novosphingobium sp.]|uniref:hypothetical protein n=1 Tax=Novosphingobium sp. TaxID=1874826 RepID=UPI001ED2E2ED|nr:hypothetical protein [Novosphingobium sp.]MBK9011260.1 hypothetical protein [Novosphingobium sp.]